jgi:uncharacterized protein YdaU (DUF1376 family)
MARRSRGEPHKPPAFQFYARDWLASTIGMPRDAKGVHIDFLCISWDSGPLPNSARWRERALGAAPKETARLWAYVRPRWTLTKRGWIHRRLEQYRRELATKRAQAQSAAAARWTGADPESASPEHAARISGEHADALRARTPSASDPHVLNGYTRSSSSSASPERTYRRRPPPVYAAPPFKVYAAIAKRAFAEEPIAELGAVAERFKRLCAEQGKPYNAEITGRALRAAERARARKSEP